MASPLADPTVGSDQAIEDGTLGTIIQGLGEILAIT